MRVSFSEVGEIKKVFASEVPDGTLLRLEAPGDQGQYDVFVQSTSVNRKLIAGTNVVYWPKVRY